MRVAILDIDINVINEIKKYLISMNYLNEPISIFEFTRSKDFIESFKENHDSFDAIFLDVQMKEMSGLEVAHIIRQHGGTELLIFLASANSKDDLAEICEVSAFRLLYKPIDDNKLCEAWKSTQIRCKSEYLTIAIGSRTKRIKIDEIIHVESNHRVITIYSQKGAYEYYNKFVDVVKVLEPYGFFCIHRGSLINLQYVEGLDSVKRLVEVSDGSKLPVSRERIHEFNAVLHSYWASNNACPKENLETDFGGIGIQHGQCMPEA